MSRITLSDIIRHVPHNPPDGTRPLVLGGVVAGSATAMYNNYSAALNKGLKKKAADTSELTERLKATIKDKVLSKLKDKYFPEYGTPFAEVDLSHGLKIHLNGPHQPVEEIYHSIKTLDDDPGNHKRKALIGLAGVGLGTAAALSASAGQVKEVVEKVTAPKGVDPKSKAYMAAGMAVPAAMYYLYRNLDRPSHAGLGVGVLAGAIEQQEAFRQQSGFTGLKDLPPEVQSQIRLANTGTLLATTSGIYAVQQLQQAADEAKLRALGMSGASEVEKAKEINRIRTKKDFLTRYPVFRPSPYSERFRSWYNKFHKPSPVVSKSDYDKYIAPKKQD